MTPQDLEAVRKRDALAISQLPTVRLDADDLRQLFNDRHNLLAFIDTPPDQATVEQVADWLMTRAEFETKEQATEEATAILQRFPGLGSGDDMLSSIAEVYQVVGYLSDAAGVFDDPQTIKVLDWLAKPEGKLDVLPYRPSPPAGEK